ncbi:hypothetical protein EsVE80_14260 [Enterococcus saigonensis]|uniref:Uncharacterized protein n=1 Tax=Enterococcus saigonensis TaxID=1805431 RepID=A0A679ICG0_9ENTE|nr:hypothetical protein EsVE80_14260 [Enterococcus saigonensis]
MGDSEETHIRHTFDSFCKKVVHNEALTFKRNTLCLPNVKSQWKYWNKKDWVQSSIIWNQI